VLALGTAVGAGQASDVSVETPLAVVARFENGLMTDYKDFGNRAEAVAAFGLTK
jgi:hypothetical protein